MALTEQERASIEKQIKDMETAMAEQALTGEGVDKTLADLKIADAFNQKQWAKFHSYIQFYELEIEGLTGEYVDDPITEKDVIEHASSGGRLYQNPNGTDTKNIPQYNGAPIKTGRPRELDNKTKILEQINLLRLGTQNSGGGSNVQGGYSAGSNTINLEYSINPGWILVGGVTLLNVTAGASGGTCSKSQYTTQTTCTANAGVWTTYYTYNISDRVNDASHSDNTSVTPIWTGFTNAERLAKDAVDNNKQGIMNALITRLDTELGKWQTILQTKTIHFSQKNKAENMDPAAVNEHLLVDAYLTTYRATKPIQDGTPGLDEVIAKINARDTYRVTRANACKEAKKEYYGQRKSFSDARADVQSGTLKRITFLSGLKKDGGFKPGGTPQQQKQLVALKKLLADG